MSDEQSSPPASLRAQGGPNGQRRRRRPAPPPVSKESRFIGYLVLGFGTLAVIAVLLLAFSGNSDPEQREANPETAKALVEELKPQPEAAAPAPAAPSPARQAAPPPAPPKELYFKRQPDISAGDMQGTWQAAIGKYTAILQLKQGSYQIIYAQPDPNAPRLYSLGTYRVLEDMVTLSPRLDWPAPASSNRVGYEILTRSPFPVLAAFQSGKMLWQNPPQSEKRVLAPYKMTANAGEDVNYIVWQKYK